MKIVYACVAVGNTIIADHSENYDKPYRNVINSMLPNIPSTRAQQRETYTDERFTCDVLCDNNGFIFVCTTTPDFPKESSLAFLEYVQAKSYKSFKKMFKAKVKKQEITGQQVKDKLNEEKVRKKISMVLAKAMTKKLNTVQGSKKKDSKGFWSSRGPSMHTDVAEVELTHMDVAQHSKDEREIVSQQDVRIQHLQEEVDEVQFIVRKNIEQLLERDDKIENLLERSDNLVDQAEQFHKTGKKLKRKKRRKYIRISFCIGATVIVLAVVVVMIPVGIVLL